MTDNKEGEQPRAELVRHASIEEIEAARDRVLAMQAKTRRDRVYAVIDGERAYQEDQRGNAARHVDRPASARVMSPGEFLLCMEHYLEIARATWTKGTTGGVECLDPVRKVTALGVAMMEAYGAPPRAGYEPPSIGADFLRNSPISKAAAAAAGPDRKVGMSAALGATYGKAEPLLRYDDKGEPDFE
jgi:hypothetical protein